MAKINDKTKFDILTDIKTYPDAYTQMTAQEIQMHFNKKFNVELTIRCLCSWAKIYNFKFKSQQRKPKPTKNEELKRTNQRIHMLGMIIRNLCKELDIKSPNMLDNLLSGIKSDYNIISVVEPETQTQLEAKLYDTL